MRLRYPVRLTAAVVALFAAPPVFAQVPPMASLSSSAAASSAHPPPSASIQAPVPSPLNIASLVARARSPKTKLPARIRIADTLARNLPLPGSPEATDIGTIAASATPASKIQTVAFYEPIAFYETIALYSSRRPARAAAFRFLQSQSGSLMVLAEYGVHRSTRTLALHMLEEGLRNSAVNYAPPSLSEQEVICFLLEHSADPGLRESLFLHTRFMRLSCMLEG